MIQKGEKVANSLSVAVQYFVDIYIKPVTQNGQAVNKNSYRQCVHYKLKNCGHLSSSRLL